MAKLTEQEIAEHRENPNVMLRIKGNIFRCKCGCNLFNHGAEMDSDIFYCNNCNQQYVTNLQ